MNTRVNTANPEREWITPFCLAIVVFCASCVGPVCSRATGNGPETDSLVPPEERVSDFSARLALARLHKWQGNLQQSITLYRQLLQSQPDNQALQLELASVLVRNDNRTQALAIASNVHENDPDSAEALRIMTQIHIRRGQTKQARQNLDQLRNMDWKSTQRKKNFLAEMYARLDASNEATKFLDEEQNIEGASPAMLADRADIYHRLGHALMCKKLYEKAISKTSAWEIRRRYANRMLLWGAFYRSEDIYRNYLKQNPGDVLIQEELISVLSSSERYAQAKELCRIILHDHPHRTSTRLLLCRIYLAEKRFAEAAQCARDILDRDEDRAEAWYLMGTALKKQSRYAKALKAFQHAETSAPWSARSLLAQADIYRKRGDAKTARRLLKKVLDNHPENVEAKFHLIPAEKRLSSTFVDNLGRQKNMTAKRLTRWARVYNARGHRPEAIQCYKYALQIDPQYFPARLELAETYGYDHQYETSLAGLHRIQEDFPLSRKITLDIARINAWSKAYSRALQIYTLLHERAPHDPLPLREKARTALWGKMFDVAMKTYEQALQPSVDQRVQRDLDEKLSPPEISDIFDHRRTHIDDDAPYALYSALKAAVSHDSLELSKPDLAVVREVLLNHQALYEIQKSLWLEQQAKRLNWNRKRLRAMETYKSLISAEPGNSEARFDLGQLQCSLGLLPEERNTYENLLSIDPMHNLANKALDRIETRSSPSLHFEQNYWHEWGRGELTDIRRQRSEARIEIPLNGRHTLGIGQFRLRNHPGKKSVFAANGQSLHWRAILTPAMRASASFEYADYRDGDAEDTYTGHASISYNWRDHVTLGIGYRRQNETVNIFGILDGTQSNRWWFQADSDINHWLQAGYRSEYIDYNDDNHGLHHSAWTEYLIFDHPRQLSIEGKIGYRDTARTNQLINNGQQLSNIIHPYWTPEDYFDGRLSLKWRHDLSDFFFCGAQDHYYQIEISAGDNSDNNRFGELKATWNYEFNDHWTINASGLLHRSRDWDANGFWLSASYHF